jgi:hypothetical protein
MNTCRICVWGLSFALSAPAFAATLDTIATTGHDQDIVFESGLTNGQVGASGELGSRQFFQDGATAADDDGLPPTVTGFTSALTGNTINFAFQPFSQNNVLKFDNASPVKSLTLAAPAAYTQLAVVFSGGSLALTETAELSFTINYNGGATQTGILNVPDWGAVTTLPSGTDRFLIADRTTANATTWPVSSDNNTTANRWAIYLGEVTPNRTDLNILSLDFGPITLNGGPLNAGDDVVVFGLAGAPVPEPAPLTLIGLGMLLSVLALRHRTSR